MVRIFVALLSTAVLAVVVPLAPHDDYRIVGVVTKVTATSLAVKQSDSRLVTMRMDKLTLVTRDKKKVDRVDLKVGAHVVVDALGDTIDDLLVIEVRLVPPPAAPKK